VSGDVEHFVCGHRHRRGENRGGLHQRPRAEPSVFGREHATDHLQAVIERVALGRAQRQETLVEELFEGPAAVGQDAAARRSQADQRLAPIGLVDPALDPAASEPACPLIWRWSAGRRPCSAPARSSCRVCARCGAASTTATFRSFVPIAAARPRRPASPGSRHRSVRSWREPGDARRNLSRDYCCGAATVVGALRRFSCSALKSSSFM
jgi:hypothetical protein